MHSHINMDIIHDVHDMETGDPITQAYSGGVVKRDTEDQAFCHTHGSGKVLMVSFLME